MKNMENKIQNSYPALQFTAYARNDIEETWLYFGEFGEDLAEKTIRQIIEKCEFLSINPKIGRERNDIILKLHSFLLKTTTSFIFKPNTAWKSTAFCIVRETIYRFSTIRLMTSNKKL